jgi:hypothetical protein
MEGARKHQALYTSPGVIATIICARLGLVERARARLVEGRTMAGPSFLTIQGELAFHDGDSDRAVELLTVATRQPYGQPQYFFAAETLALALLGSGRLAEAITTLEAAAAERQRAYDPAYGGPLAGYAWLRVRLLQAELYARASRIADSRRVAAEIARLLAKADSDFPILQRAQQLLTNQSLTAPGDAYKPTTRD